MIEKIKKFIDKNKTYILIIVIIIASVTNLLLQNFQEKDVIEINNNEINLNKNNGKIGVYITGEVKNPGVYYIEENSRLNDLVELSGGVTNRADLTDINLAEILNDADKINIPKLEEKEFENDEESERSNLININTATKEELKSLNGIGNSTAESIIEYRKNNKFETIEDIQKVNGIGKSKYEAIKEYICV